MMSEKYDYNTNCDNCNSENTFRIEKGKTISSYFSISHNGGIIRKCKYCGCDVDPNGTR